MGASFENITKLMSMGEFVGKICGYVGGKICGWMCGLSCCYSL